MPNTFGPDILLQVPDPAASARFYVDQLGFHITLQTDEILGLQGPNINLYLERGPSLGPVLEVFVEDVPATTERLVESGCVILKHEPEFPRTYIRDPFGLIYNVAKKR